MKKYLSIFVACLLCACSTAQEMLRPQPISFTQYPLIQLNVANIEIKDEYTSPQQKPNVEHLMPVSPAEAMHGWVADRLRATGGSRTLQVIIRDASVKETELPRTEGVKGVFTNDQAYRYDARLDVEMRIYGDRALSEASLNTLGTRSETIPENASVLSRDKAFNTMIKKLMMDVNAELEKNIFTYFGRYLDYNVEN